MLRRSLVASRPVLPHAARPQQVAARPSGALCAPARALLCRPRKCACQFSTKVSGDSAKEFLPESKAPSQDHEVQDWLKKAVQENKVLLFMKGTPEAPQCGFSRKVAVILKEHKASFSSADVLSSPEIREGIKVFSNWPTLPQLYIGGEFIGGCDIVSDMAASGELKGKLEKAGAVKKL
jgi:monothiol glutaredoxin